MTNKELRIKLAEYPDDTTVYLKDDGITFLVNEVEEGYEYHAAANKISWWYRPGKPDDEKDTRKAICLLAD